MRAPEQRVDLREESVIGTGNGPSSRISMINGPPNNLPSVTEDGGEGGSACHDHPCREAAPSIAFDNVMGDTEDVKVSHVPCVCSIVSCNIMLVASLLLVAGRRETSLLLLSHHKFCLLQGWTPRGMQHQPMAQQRHDPVAIGLFFFSVVRTGD